MLVLSRKPGEVVVIGDDIRIEVLSVSGKQVRIGFDIPKDIPVHREEIHEKIQADKNGNTSDTETDNAA